MTRTASWRRLAFVWLAPAFVLAGLLTLSSLPGSPRAIISLPFSDTVAHFGIYMCLGSVLLRALWLTDSRLERPAILLASTLIAAGIGGLDEFYQGHVLYRTPEFADLYADAAGAFTGGALMLAFFHIVRRRTTKGSNSVE